MSKTVYLLSEGSQFIAFGSGMVIESRNHDVDVRSVSNHYLMSLSTHSTGEEVEKAFTSWVRTIASAPDGALLRWCIDRQCVVDELSDATDYFEDAPIVAQDAQDGQGGK